MHACQRPHLFLSIVMLVLEHKSECSRSNYIVLSCGCCAQRIPGITKSTTGLWMVDGGCANVHKLPSVGFNLGTADAPKYFDIPPILWTKPVRLDTAETQSKAQTATLTLVRDC